MLQGKHVLLPVLLWSCASMALWVDGWQMNGFASAGVARTDVKSVNYLEPNIPLPVGAGNDYFITLRGRPEIFGVTHEYTTHEDTLMAIQISADVGERLRATAQLLAKGSDIFDVTSEWAFISWSPADAVRLRAGRLRWPAFLLSEYLEVGHAYPWTTPPDEVYGQLAHANYTGFDMAYDWAVGDWDLTSSWYAGSSNVDFFFSLQTEVQLRDFVGVNFLTSNGWLTLRAGYTRARVDFEPQPLSSLIGVVQGATDFYNGQLSAMLSPTISSDDLLHQMIFDGTDASFWGVGYQLEWRNWLSIGEYTRRLSDIDFLSNTEAAYITVGYRFGTVLPHVTYAHHRSTDDHHRVSVASHPLSGFDGLINSDDAGGSFYLLPPGDAILSWIDWTFSGEILKQETVTLGVRWDFMPAADLKFDMSWINPYEGTGQFDIDPHGRVHRFSLVLDVVF